jgi:hypothetical protein
MSVIIVFLIVSNVPVSLFASVKPYLFTTYFNVWELVLRQPVPWAEVANSVAILGAFSAGFFVVSWYIFLHKDILS